MYTEHPAFEKPEDENAKIWRYMDFTKLVSLLDKKALYFSRLDCLSDKFEGSYPRVNIEKRNKSLDEGPIKKMLPSYDRERHIKLRSKMHKAERKTFCVNSWHINNHESAAMWKLYSKSDEGIAIQSTFKRLCNILIMRRTPYQMIVTRKYIYVKQRTPLQAAGHVRAGHQLFEF